MPDGHRERIFESSSARLAGRVSQALIGIHVEHTIKVKADRSPSFPEGHLMRGVQGISRFESVRDFAAALAEVGVDASYSAESGWHFKERE